MTPITCPFTRVGRHRRPLREYQQSNKQLAKFQTDWFKTVENRSDSKTISDSGVMYGAMSDREIKNPSPLS